MHHTMLPLMTCRIAYGGFVSSVVLIIGAVIVSKLTAQDAEVSIVEDKIFTCEARIKKEKGNNRDKINNLLIETDPAKLETHKSELEQLQHKLAQLQATSDTRYQMLYYATIS